MAILHTCQQHLQCKRMLASVIIFFFFFCYCCTIIWSVASIYFSVRSYLILSWLVSTDFDTNLAFSRQANMLGKISVSNSLRDQVIPYGDLNLGQNWHKLWLVAWWHQAIIWTRVHLSYNMQWCPVTFIWGREILLSSTIKVSLKITLGWVGLWGFL